MNRFCELIHDSLPSGDELVPARDGVLMRWDNLFEDLESQLERDLSAEQLDRAAEEERLRLGRLCLRDRLLALHDSEQGSNYRIALTLGGGRSVTVHPVSFGKDWFSADLYESSGRMEHAIVPIAAIETLGLTAGQSAASLRQRAEEQHPALSARLGLAFVLRDVCRRRRAATFDLATSSVHGTIDRVARDHVDLAVHEPGVPRRSSAVSELRLVPFASIVLVRL